MKSVEMRTISCGVAVGIATGLFFSAAAFVDEKGVVDTGFVPGIGVLYFPAGFALVGVLLSGGWCAAGIFVAAVTVNLLHFFPGQIVKALGAAAISALTPYAIYRIAIVRFGLQESLSNLSAKWLFNLALFDSIANAALIQAFVSDRPRGIDAAYAFVAQFVSHLLGIFVVLYAIRLVVSIWGCVCRNKG